MKKKTIFNILGILAIILCWNYIFEICEKHDRLLDEYNKQKQEELEDLFYADSMRKAGIWVEDTVEEKIIDSPPPPKKKKKSTTPRHTNVTITRYHPVKKETNDDPIHTADASEISMAKLQRGHIKWVAVSRDLLKKYGYGSKIRIETGDPEIDGVYEVHDTMNKRWTARVDILTHPKSDMGRGKWEGKIKKVKS